MIHPERLLEDLDALARHGRTEDGGVSRSTYSEADLAARRWLEGRAAEAGLEYREDAVGNVHIRLGGPADAPEVWVGSHLDSVPNGGRLDGALGVIAALEVLRAIREEGPALKHGVVGVSFADEEGAYGGFLGSKASMGRLTDADISAAASRDGTPLRQAMRAAGFDPDGLASTVVDPARIRAFIELHIEQGAVLEHERLSIGVVTDIVGVLRGSVSFVGRADHAGATPMHLRKDALGAAAQLLTRVPGLPERVGGVDAVITCGRVEVAPGAENIVPARVDLHFDVRDRDAATVMALEAALEADAAAICLELGIDSAYRRTVWTPPTPLDKSIRALLSRSAESLGISHREMPSGAGHDSQVLAPKVPTGMIFVPSIAGRSHSPLEATDPEDIVRGVRVLHRTIRALATGDV
jgi:N-carbamoyl-L-amino-acid hydrolase